MTPNLVELGPQYFPMSSIGTPVGAGSLYVGDPDTDPTISGNQKSVSALKEDNTLIVITQPITLSAGGIPLYNGSPVSLYVSGNYSLTILDINGAQIYYVPSFFRIEGNPFTPGNFYYPDYSEADQGVTGDDETIKFYVDQIGIIDKATIYLRHNSGNEFTDYIIGTTEVIPDNITLERESGARIIDDTNDADFTINGPFISPLNIAFDWGNGSGTLTFGVFITEAYAEWMGDIDGTADNVQINAAIAALTAGNLQLLNDTYTIASTINAKSNINIVGYGDSSLLLQGANIMTMTLDGVSNVILRDFKIDGQKDTYTETVDVNTGIWSPDNGVGCSEILVENVTIVDMKISGITFLGQTGSHGTDIKILNNRILDSGAHGIATSDFVDDVLIQGNRIIHWGDSFANRVGIVTGRDSVNQQILGNLIVSNGNELGASCHAISMDTAENFVVADNIVVGGNAYGIECGFSSIGTIIGNTINGTIKSAIAVIGDGGSSNYCNNVNIIGNTIYDLNEQGIYIIVNNFVATKHTNINVVNNVITDVGNSDKEAIHIQYAVNGVVSGNTIIDSYLVALYFESSDYFQVNGNMIKNSNSSGAAANDFGIRLITSTFIIKDGFLELNSNNAATSGAGEDDLRTLTIPQYFHQSWKGLRITAFGDKTNANGNKTIKIHWGSGAYTFNAAANDTNDWRVEAELLFRDGASQWFNWFGWNGTTPLMGFEPDAEDMDAGDIILKITGECADASDVITQRGWMVELF